MFQSNIKQVQEQIRRGIIEDVQNATEVGFLSSQQNVPVDTGRLRDSGQMAVFDENGTLIAGSGGVPSPGATGSITGSIFYDTGYAATVAVREQSEGDHYLDGGFQTAATELQSGLEVPKG